ncbi:MAG: LPS assembly lipoprotein LptE [Pseudolabrys sp.]
MWSPDSSARQMVRLTLRLAAVFAVAGLAGGCFQPVYGDRSAFGASASITPALQSVDIATVRTSGVNDRLPRVGGEVRNELTFALTGGGGQMSPTHRLNILLTAIQQQIIVDIDSGRPDTQNYGIDATYTLVDLATGRPVVNGYTSARVSFNIPGLQQRFAGERGLRDAENRAAKVIAENIRNRLASYFTSGT